MTSRLRWVACIALVTLTLPAASLADENQAAGPKVEHELQAPLVEPQPARSIVTETPGGWNDPAGEVAIEDWKSQNPYGYGTDTLFPLTRGVAAADLPLWAKIPVYALTGIFDVIQLPIGAVGGLWGN